MPERDKEIGGLIADVSAIKLSLAEDRESRRLFYGRMEAFGLSQQTLANKMIALEAEIAKMAPAFTDYLRKTEQVHGAGKLGRFLWWFGGWILSAAVALYSGWHWLVGK